MKTISTNITSWRTTFLAVCGAFLLLCCTTAFAQTTYGPYAAGTTDFSGVDDLYNGSLGSMAASPIAVSGVAGTSVIDISVNVAITHSWVGDIVLKLQSPNGSVLTLMSRPGYAETIDDGSGCCGASSDWTGQTVTFADNGVTDAELLVGPPSGSYYPNAGITVSAGSFAALFGGSMNGTWTLYAGDAGSGDLGTINSWSITIVAAAPSFTLTKVVAVEGGNGDCLDDPIAVTDNITVSPGTGVCYWYIADNTGDVAFDLIDFYDDQLLPGGLVNSPGFDLAVGSALAIPWSSTPVVINATVTNVADVTYYNSTLGLSAGPVSDNATVNVGIPPANDLCADAIALSCGDVVSGSTAAATIDGPASDCSGGSVAADVWYTVVGTGGDITASLCGSGYDTQLDIYTGSCGSLVNNGGCNDDFCGLQSEATWTSTLGVTYYVRVHGFGGATGAYTLAITCAAPANDLCANAIALSCGDVASGSTVAATIDGDASSCTGGSVAADVWYTVVGTGGDITASLCGSGYDTKLDIYTGSCGSLVNNGGCNDDFCGLQSEATWTSTLGVTYYVRVHGFGGATGAYTLAITCPGPVNDLCADAVALSCGDVVSGSTAFATIDGPASSCTGGSVAADVWYSVVGTGGDITASLCGSGYDTKLDIYTGSCGSLVNNGGCNDDFCGLQSEATWTSTLGVTYLVRVHGFGGATGAYTLAITCAGPVNDLCANAIALSCGDVASGSTATATIDGPSTDCSGGSVAADVWYSVVGTGGDITASLCGSGYDTQLDIYTGSCGSLVNNGGCNDDFCGLQSEATWTSTLGVTYYVRVHGFGGATGAYTLAITCATDCNGVAGGTAFLDNCGDCVGGNTGLTACVQDCNGDFGGTAFVDNCGDCVGGSTGLTACVQDCNGDFGGTAFVDNCGDCVGGSTGLTACVQDCNGDFGGTAFVDDCGDCVGGNTGLTPCIPIGVEETLVNGLSVYPNPNNGQFIIEMNAVEGAGTLSIMDLTGRLVYTEGVTLSGNFRKELNLNVAKGTYVLQMSTLEGLVNRKIVID